MPTVKRVLYACQFKSKPQLLEPLYQAEITVPQQALSGVYQTLNMRRGVVENTEERAGKCLLNFFFFFFFVFFFQLLLEIV